MTDLEELKALLDKVGSPSRKTYAYLVGRDLGVSRDIINYIKDNNIDFANADDEENPDCDRAYLDFVKFMHYILSLEEKYGFDTSEDDIDEE